MHYPHRPLVLLYLIETVCMLDAFRCLRSVWRRQLRSAGRSCDPSWRRVRIDVRLMLGRRTRNHCVRARGEHWFGWIVYPIQPVAFDPFWIGLGFDLKFWFGYGHQSNARYQWTTRHEQVLENDMHPVALNLWIWSLRLHVDLGYDSLVKRASPASV